MKHKAVNLPRTLIMCDPAWQYKTWSGKNQTRNADNHYACMSNQELLDLAPLINAAAGPESIMGMWCTPSNLKFAIQLLEAWGYSYRTILFNWVKLNKSFNERLFDISKTNVNMPMNENESIAALEKLCFVSLGHFSRSNVEMVIVGKKGKEPINRMRKDVRQIILAPVGEHSVKPDEANKRFELLFRRPQDPPPIELFARRQYKDFLCTGLELDGLDIRKALQKIANGERWTPESLSIFDVYSPVVYIPEHDNA